MSQTIGSITFDSNEIIGEGTSSVVYRGKFGQRVVAVKRVDKKDAKLNQKEISLLQKSDQDSYIIRYFTSEEDQRYTYIALELCSATLKDFVTRNDLKSKLTQKAVVEKLLGVLK